VGGGARVIVKKGMVARVFLTEEGKYGFFSFSFSFRFSACFFISFSLFSLILSLSLSILLHPFSISFTPFCSSLKSPLPPLIQPPSNLFFLPTFFFPQIFALTFFCGHTSSPWFCYGSPLFIPLCIVCFLILYLVLR